MSYPFRNLVFEGGGVKGIAYVGALKVLEERKILNNVMRVGGTSAGAINAILLGVGYTLAETKDVLWNLDFNNFMDDSWGIIRDTKRLINEFGWYKTDYFRSWIGNLIREKTGNENSTFNELKKNGFRELYIVGTNLSTGFSEVFSPEHTPRMSVADAARISMSIPLFFASVRNIRKDVYVDGGVLNNYPIKLFDREKYLKRADIANHTRKPEYYKEANATAPKTSSKYVYNKESLGFRLDSAIEIAQFRDGAAPQRKKIEDFFDYASALVQTIMDAQNNQHMHSDDWHRTVYVNTIGISATDFDLKDEKKEELFNEGANGTEKYFEWYDNADPEDMPVNHPKFKD